MEIVAPALVATSPMRAGLGNRLRLILSSQAIADGEGRSFYYHWPVGEERGKLFGAHFTELWQYEGGTSLLEPGPEPRIEFSQFATGNLTEVRNEAVISVTGNTLIPGFGTGPWWGSLLPSLRPTEEVAAASAPVARRLGEGYVGVQVRAHPTLSHRKTLTESPASWFVNRMKELLEEQPDLTFFLSCDYPPAQREIIEAVPNVIASTKTGEYNSRAALVESVSDLLVLSRSSRISEPYASTFAKVAWLMADRSMPIENSVKSQPGIARKTLQGTIELRS